MPSSRAPYKSWFVAGHSEVKMSNFKVFDNVTIGLPRATSIKVIRKADRNP